MRGVGGLFPNPGVGWGVGLQAGHGGRVQKLPWLGEGTDDLSWRVAEQPGGLPW